MKCDTEDSSVCYKRKSRALKRKNLLQSYLHSCGFIAVELMMEIRVSYLQDKPLLAELRAWP